MLSLYPLVNRYLIYMYILKIRSSSSPLKFRTLDCLQPISNWYIAVYVRKTLRKHSTLSLIWDRGAANRGVLTFHTAEGKKRKKEKKKFSVRLRFHRKENSIQIECLPLSTSSHKYFGFAVDWFPPTQLLPFTYHHINHLKWRKKSTTVPLALIWVSTFCDRSHLHV